MEVLFLHISDLHIKSVNGVYEFQLKKITDTILTLGKFQALLIIFSGDLAYSGLSDQYNAVIKCKDALERGIRKNCAFKGKIEFVCTPGNHDVSHATATMSGAALQEIRKTNTYEKYISSELMKQKDFFSFATKCNCFTDGWMFHQSIIDLDGFSIEINNINSALFSLRDDEDKGLHFLPRHCFNKLSTPTGADFVISLMHHSPDWLIDDQKNELEPVLFSKSSIVFLGHEHNTILKSIIYEEGAETFIQAGGCLCNDDDWAQSSFHLGLLDTKTREYHVSEYFWNKIEKQYETRNEIRKILPNKPSLEKKLEVRREFSQALRNDPKREISGSLFDYFVFPRIILIDPERPTRKEFTSEESFCAEILKSKQIVIMGGYNAGKSALLKKLFFTFSNQFVVIMCSIDNIRGKRPDRVVRECFEDIYGENPSDFYRYKQMPRAKKILIIDDIDMIASVDFDHFVDCIQDDFECLIFSARFTIDINLLERMKEILNTKDSITRYRLAPFFADKRIELISAAVNILTIDKLSAPRITKGLADAITSQKRFISLDPDFILKYVECYCKNIGDAGGNDSGVFSKVFEASIINSISKFQTSKITVDKIFMVLALIAHQIHFNRIYPISETEIRKIIDGYNEYYGSLLDVNEAIRIMLQAKIMISCEGQFRFSNSNYLAFFVAKEVNRRYNDSGDDKDLRYLLTYACFGINSDILLFISYITDNIKILRYIIDMTKEYTNSWAEFVFNNSMPSFLWNAREHVLALPSENAKEEERLQEVEKEKCIDESIKTIEIYDYSEEGVEQWENQIIRAASLLTLIARCLPAFEHCLPKSEKDKIVEEVFRLPNRIFLHWAEVAEKETTAFIQYFKERSQEYYLRQKEASDDEIIQALQWGAMSLLLEMYDIAITCAAKDNTYVYLEEYNYNLHPTYKLEHLLMLEKQGASSIYVKAAHTMSEDDVDAAHLYQTMLRRIVDHALVHMDSLDFRQRQQLTTKFQINAAQQKILLVDRQKTTRQKDE